MNSTFIPIELIEKIGEYLPIMDNYKLLHLVSKEIKPYNYDIQRDFKCHIKKRLEQMFPKLDVENFFDILKKNKICHIRLVHIGYFI